jgi:alkylhydroperoxidase family enzyme
MAWFRNRETTPKADPERARALLAEAQSLRTRGDLANAQELAKQALEEGTQAHGERHPALVPFLLVYAGLLNQLRGWSAGKPFYERAQRLRSALGRGSASTSS